MSRVSYIANFQIYIGINSFVHIALPYCVLYIKTSLFITSSRWRNGSCGTCCCSVWCFVWDVSASYRLRWNTANQAYAWVTGSRTHTQQQSRISTEWNINIQIKQDPDKEVTQCKDCSLGKCRHVHRLRSTTQHLTTGHSSTWSLCLFERRCAVLPMFIHEHNSATLHQEIHLQHSWQKLQELECTQNSTIRHKQFTRRSGSVTHFSFFFSVLQKISSTLFLINAQQQLNILSFSWTDDQESDGEDSRPLLDRVQLHSLEPWIETAALDRELH